MMRQYLHQFISAQFATIVFQICFGGFICLANSTDHDISSLDNYGGNFSDEAASVDILVQIKYCLDNRDTHKAWQLLVDYVNSDSEDFGRHTLLIVFQQLSYAEFRLENANEQYQKSDDNALSEYKKIEDFLNRIVINRKELFQVFAEMKKQISQCLGDEIKEIHTNKTIQHALNHAKEAFRRGDYVTEAEYLKRALQAGAPVEEQVEQSLRFIDGIRYFERNEYEKAIECLSGIKINDRHYLIAQETIDKSKNGIFQRNGLKDIRIAWKLLDWDGLDRLVSELPQNPRYQVSSMLKREVELTTTILNMRNEYLNHLSDSSREALKSLNNIKNLMLKDNIEVFENAIEWISQEQYKLIPVIKEQLILEASKAQSGWQAYKDDPISIEEINNLNESSNFIILQTKCKKLSQVYDKTKNAVLLKNLLHTHSLSDDVKAVSSSVVNIINAIERDTRSYTELFLRRGYVGLFPDRFKITIYETALMLPDVSDDPWRNNIEEQLRLLVEKQERQ